MTLPILDYSRPADRAAVAALLHRLRSGAEAAGPIAQTVAEIIENVRREGDAAVVRYMRQWTNPDFTPGMIRVTPEEMAAAERGLAPDLRTAMRRSIEHVRTYQRHIMPGDPPPIAIDGAELGLRFTPIERVGLHVPGGKAAYPSSLIMLAVPAQVAGVDELSVVCPPPTSGGHDISPLVLAVAHMLGLQNLYRIGGAQAIAALAFGTETIGKVDFIAGPGNAFTQQAKRQLFGQIGIDGFFGPSEIVVVADESANPAWIAADLLAQAEHDPGCCFVVARSRAVIEAIAGEVVKQLPRRRRREPLEKSLREWSAGIVVPDDAALIELVDMLAAEHVTLATADPKATLKSLRNGGAWFLGDATPVASGDYYAGPSHCLPTGTTARFTSGLSVYTFLKRSSVESYPAGLPPHAIADIAALAEAEGLDAHAESVRQRGRG